MKTSFYIDSKSAIDFINTFYIRDTKANTGLNYTSVIDEFYLSSRTLFEVREMEKIKQSESPKFGKLFNLQKPISIIPTSYTIYTQIENIEDEAFIDIDLTEGQKRISKLDYINHFYQESNEDPLTFEFKNDISSRYLDLNDFFIKRMEKIHNQKIESTILSFLPQKPLKVISDKKIAPYLYIERTPKPDTMTLSQFFNYFPNLWDDFNSFVLYTNLNDFSQLDQLAEYERLSNFKNILIWITDFKELYATKNEIKALRKGLTILSSINENIIFLFGGLLNKNFFSDLIKEIIYRTNIYPSKTFLPNSSNFGTQRKKIFFPYFGRVSTPERILDARFRNRFNCECHSCSNFIQNRRLNVLNAIRKIENSIPMNFYHNFYGFLKKVYNNEPVEVNPNIAFNQRKLFKTWEEALNE